MRIGEGEVLHINFLIIDQSYSFLATPSRRYTLSCHGALWSVHFVALAFNVSYRISFDTHYASMKM